MPARTTKRASRATAGRKRTASRSNRTRAASKPAAGAAIIGPPVDGQLPAGFRCLSVCQPWAWAIVRGFKTIENRGRSTNYRGWLGIHASGSNRHLTLDNDLLLQNMHPTIAEAMNARAAYCDEHKNAPFFAAGGKAPGIIGAVRVVGCCQFDITRLQAEAEAAGVRGSIDVAPAEWAQGPFCWLLADGVEFDEPIGCKGRLNLWQPPADVGVKIAEAMAAKLKS